MDELPNRDVVIFTEAVNLPADERAAYLDRACGGDARLRQRVEALLQTYGHVGDFLEESAQKASIVAKMRGSTSEEPGDRIGRYKLLQQIGEGGCGVVYMAEQEEPVRRRVALKIIKLGMDTKAVIARFEAERQALALMDHPNIAKVLDAGTTESGRPYFVMQLIRGEKITEYCDQQSLSTNQRLRLFIQVCEAVQHAHQKGIIHRDIKPSNILVTTSAEGVASPVVIDFGIAKATTDQRLTDKTLFTAFEMFIGTPAYMSPEQAALTSVDVDTRSDIYSLGVLLYELLTSSTPFEIPELLKKGLDEIRRVIQTEEPVRPSTRLSSMVAANLTSVSRQRQSEPPKLIRDVRGDLDWIVMKALEKDRARRYATANGLAMDIQRFLTGEVVSARPPSTLYKFQKLVLRNKLLVSGSVIFLCLLLALLGFMGVLLVRERRLRDQSDLLAADTLANSYIQDSKPEIAEPLFLRALEIRRKLTPGYLPTPQSLDNLIWALLNQGKFSGAEALLTGLLAPADSSRKEYVDLLALRAEVLARSGRWSKAQADAQRLLELHPEYFGYYHMLAPLMVANKDLEGYRLLCAQIIARFNAPTSPVGADQMAKDCLILDSSGVNLAPVAAMAEFAVSKGELEPAYTFFQCCKALAEYRQGHFDGAVKWAQHAAMNPFPYSRAEAYAILAMGQYRLDEVTDARITLAKCENVVRGQLPALRTRDLGGDWRDWIIAHALLDEAHKLLGTSPSNPDSSKPISK